MMFDSLVKGSIKIFLIFSMESRDMKSRRTSGYRGEAFIKKQARTGESELEGLLFILHQDGRAPTDIMGELR